MDFPMDLDLWMSFRKNAQTLAERRDPIQEFADRIVELLEQGVKLWFRDVDLPNAPVCRPHSIPSRNSGHVKNSGLTVMCPVPGGHSLLPLNSGVRQQPGVWVEA